MEYSEEWIERYSRHIILPEIGGAGQRKLSEARVLVLGAGGLGSPVAFYLTAAGIGKLGIVDSDVVDLSNLQRQILHNTNDIGRPKSASAKEKLNALNPDVEIVEYQTRINSENAFELFDGYDIIVDGSDNFPTRFLANDAAVMLKKPLVHGAILRFDGQLFTIIPGDGPCYRCIFRDPPPPGAVPNCQQAGVLGAIAGIIGTLQATEVIKLAVGKGEPLKGRLLVVDALNMTFREVKIRKIDNCPVCGENPTITKLLDYELICGVGEEQTPVEL